MSQPVFALFRDANFTRAFLAPFLLFCISCATAFPVENLKEGMTAEAVREEFDAPTCSPSGKVGHSGDLS